MDAETALRASMVEALGLDPGAPVRIAGRGTLDAAYPVSALANASVASVAIATAGLIAATGSDPGEPEVDRALADGWFGLAVQPVGWSAPSPWDPIAGDYPALDGWVRLHTNAPHHRAAALRVLGVAADRDAVGAAVAGQRAAELEDAVVAEGGCAAILRSPEEWATHPQGVAVAAEPLVGMTATAPGPSRSGWAPEPARPLAGLRVLDLTRVLAGPAATRLLAGLGAEVLRIDPPGWNEPGVEQEMTLGKRTARLDVRDPAGLAVLAGLLSEADVLVHGYRRDALEGIGLGDEERAALRPGLVDVALDAYGWSGPWADRRGFDSLVQMSTGIAGSGLRAGTADAPTPLPVQALDQATGYLMAAAALAGLTRRLADGAGSRWRLSLARTALELERARALPAGKPGDPADPPAPTPLDTAWGPALLLLPPFRVGATELRWERGCRPLGGDAPSWALSG
ncbi:MAG TPA: CoA transferase [Pseudolysinimonas sp.]|nr:CoA transferase [Pseudolysinimonas sp.]